MRKLLVGAILCLAAGSASAASIFSVEQEMPYRRWSLEAGAGNLNYFSGGAGGTSGVWDARIGFAIIPMLSIEGSYTGAAGDAPGSGALIATMVEGDARVNFLARRRINPFAFAGVGWGAFTGTGRFESDNGTVTMPLGVGADYRISDHFMAGGRFTFRGVFNDHLGPFNSSAENWAFTGNVGTKF
jgi:hypothetical protein